MAIAVSPINRIQEHIYQYPNSLSSTEKIDISELLHSRVFNLNKESEKNVFYIIKIPYLFCEVDISSVWPSVEYKTETYLIEEYMNKSSEEKNIEYDILVRMQPRRKYKINLNIKSINKATPKIVVSDLLDF